MKPDSDFRGDTPLVHPEATAIERALIESFHTANLALNQASKAIESHFHPLIRAALTMGDVTKARQILSRMPGDCISTVFAMDMLREAVLSATSPDQKAPSGLPPTLREIAFDDDYEIMTIDEFRDALKCGAYVDDDGYGLVATATEQSDILIHPSSFDGFALPDWATHIVWYNR